MLIATPTIAFPTARGITTPGKKATPTCRAKAKKIKNSARRRKALRRCVKTKSKKNGRRRTN
jgi:hypothetical protein